MKAQDMYRVQCLDCEYRDCEGRLDYVYASNSSALLVAEDHLEVWKDHNVIITQVTLCTSEEK